jgi:hypothetical protein
MKKNLYLFKASVMVYADNVVDAQGLVSELNGLHNTCCYVDDESALKITDKKSLTEWLEYCPLEFIESDEPVFSLHTTEEILDGADDTENNPHAYRIYELKRERAELKAKINLLEKELLQYQD